MNQEQNQPFWKKKSISNQNYQAVSNDTKSGPIKNKNIMFKLKILDICSPNLIQIILESMILHLQNRFFPLCLQRKYCEKTRGFEDEKQ
jgi:hypothetical protein